MRYDAHETLTAPARTSAHPLRLAGGVVLVILLYLPLAYAYASFAPGALGYDGSASLLEGRAPLAVLILLFGFTFLIFSLGMTLRLVHQRGLGSLIGPSGPALAQFLRCLRYLLPLYLVLTLMPMPADYQLSPNLSPGRWILWLPLALPCVLIQTSAEELVFRGYLQSQLAARFRSPVIWVGLPSALFALFHVNPQMPAGETWAVMIWAGFFGVAAADLTARTGTLGPALALHFINNVFAILVTAPAGQLDGLALYTFPLPLGEAGFAWYVLPIELIFTLCAWLTARIALRC
ncbi:CPBP family intramembrane glutamic endopeptidase [Roseovarius indicus]|uniref:CPBP family intramembrane glutamic endopeptidase n=1 Tax=Roseovarius indicus TaxID=540747 RepID=UPI0032EEFBF6